MAGVYTLSFKGTGSVTASGGASFTLNGTGATDRVQVYFTTTTTSVTFTVTGTVTEGQLNHGLIAQDYVETTTTAVVEGLTADLPRLDYSGGASCPCFVLEPSRTNLVSQ